MSTGTIAIAMLALLPVVVLLRRKVAGPPPLPLDPDTSWERLVAQYGAPDVTDKHVFEKLGGKVGLGYTGVGGDERGLVLWHPGHKGARIPWGDIRLVPGRYMGAPSFRVEALRAPDVSILIPRRNEDRLRARAGAAWPGVASAANGGADGDRESGE